jgi:hypothetical protein
MNPRVVAVKLFLGELGLDPNAPEDELQCAIYLSQARGVDLGYRFGFYWSDHERKLERTPASPELERDLSELREILAHDPKKLDRPSLHTNVSRALGGVKRLLGARPSKTPAGKWIKLLAMLEYQITVRKENEPRLGRRESHLYRKAMATLEKPAGTRRPTSSPSQPIAHVS